jgi:F420-dependent oxidoreductase-like protein
MKLGLHISDFTWDGGPSALRDKLGDVAARAEEAGYDRVSVMDHLWQIAHLGPPEHEMLEAYTALGFLAARTERVKLLTVVTAVVYRDPGLLAKAVTTLDVLSGGRAMLGIGAAWNEEESRGLGLLFPSTAERFERLEEALQICQQMWSDDDGPYEGKHYHLARTLNSPRSLSRPHPPILIGGAGERKTLRLVAQYADACNIFDTPERLTSSRCCASTASAWVATTTRSRRPPSCASTSVRTENGSSRRSSTCTSSPVWVSRWRTGPWPTSAPPARWNWWPSG